METIRSFFSVCWSILDIEIKIFDYSFTLLQVLYFSVIAYGLLCLVFKLISDKRGDKD